MRAESSNEEMSTLEVEALSQKANRYFLEAFDSLDPTAQLENKQKFFEGLDFLDKTVNDRLESIGTHLTEESKAPFDAVDKALNDAASKFTSAVDRNTEATNNFSAAVDRNTEAASSFGNDVGTFGASVDKFATAKVDVVVTQIAPTPTAVGN